MRGRLGSREMATDPWVWEVKTYTMAFERSKQIWSVLRFGC